MIAIAERCTVRPIIRANAWAPLAPGRVASRRPVVARGLADSASHSVNVVAQLAADNAAMANAAAGTSSTRGDGPLDALADLFEAILKVLDSGLEAAHVPYSYGFSIILLTILVKALTFPLSQQQVKSTVAMQALQPSVKEIQAKYAGDPDTLNMETARLYREAGVNPLAGCLPTLATIPVFIGLYKSLSNAASDGLLQQDFFWIPSLAGPTTMAARDAGGGMDWLFPLVDGHPPIGWASAAAYLVMPILLVVSQYASQKIMQPAGSDNKDDPANQSQAILKFLPLMIGWFSLNVPSGLTLYWFVNNILSTAQQLYLKSSTQATVAAPKPVEAAPATGTVIKPKENRVKENKKASGKDLNSRKKGGDAFRARQARDAAAKAAEAAKAETSAAPAAAEAPAPAVEAVAPKEEK